jgi:cell division septal protein FtsQ
VRARASRFRRLDLRRPQASPIAGQVWTRASLRRPKQLASGRRWRALAVAAALAELAALAWLLAGPAFQVRHVEVTGTRHLPPERVIAVAGLGRPASVFSVDPSTVRRRLAGNPWVRSSTVTTELPDRVLVRIDEWAPVAVYRAGPGGPFYLSGQAVALGAASGPERLVEILGPAQPEPRPGHAVMEVPLLVALVNIQRAFPGQFGQEVARYQTDCAGNLSLETRRGWKVHFGRVITPEEFSALRLKLSALKAVQAREDFNSPDLEYVNLMDASMPAVKRRSAGPAPPVAPVPCRG